jgi:uncharacterized protein (TIGR03435 family)
MLRSVSCAIVSAGLAIFIASGQTPAAAPSPTFEVATVKLTDPEFGGMLVQFPGGRFSLRGFTLKDLIAFAYHLDASQISGGPKWFSTDKYDIVAKPKEGRPTMDQARLMLQPLLADRFQLKTHTESKVMSVYVLTVGKNGSKLRPRTEGDGGDGTRLLFQGAKLPGRNVPVKQLAEALQVMVLDRPVLDKTGLTGNFDFDLAWRPEADQFRGRGASLPSNPDDPDIFTAMLEQLGLKLEATKAPADAIVVDSAEKATEN